MKKIKESQAYEDISNIDACNIFIMLLNDKLKGSGQFFEFGFAIAKFKHIIVIGKNSKNRSMFVNNLLVREIYDNVDDFLSNINKNRD